MLELLSATLFAEIVIFGAAPLQVSGIELRPALLLGIAIAATIRAQLRLAQFIRWTPTLLMFVVFVLSWGILLPAFGGTDIQYAKSDIAPLLPLLVCPLLVDSPKWRQIELARTVCTAALAIVAGGLLLFTLLAFLYQSEMLAFLTAIPRLVFVSSEEPGTFFVTPADWYVRFYTSTMGLLLVGLRHAHMEFVFRRKRKYLLLAVFFLASIFSTSTRGLLLGVLVYFIFWYVLKSVRMDAWRFVRLASVCIGGSYLLTLTLLPLFAPEFLQYLGIGRNISDEERFELAISLFDYFGQAPLLGHGFGFSGAVNRSEATPYSYELSNLALLSKVGIAGVLLIQLMLSKSIALAISPASKVTNAERSRLLSLLALTCACVVTSATNPLFSGLQLFCLCLYISLELSFIKNLKNRQLEVGDLK
ncbi:MAG: O-antigen ligase family protein [Nitrososphaerales archaeon]